MSLAAAAMLTACSNDTEVAMPKQDAISFDGFVNKSTRATEETDIENLKTKGFGVFGYMDNKNGRVFTNEKVTFTNNAWTYTNKQYWTAGKNYWFFALAPHNTADRYEFTPADNLDEGGTIKANIGVGEYDLIFAKSAKITTPDPLESMEKVPFTFDHLLSRVKFCFKNSLGNNNTSFVVSNVSIEGFVNKGTYTINTEKWALDGNAEGTGLSFGSTESILNGQEGITDYKFMFPTDESEEGVAYVVNFVVKVSQGSAEASTYTHRVLLPQTKMVKGHSYRFTAELDAENINPDGTLLPIEFTVDTVNEWGEWENVTTEVPNNPETL